jgi:uncharacterized lipoprotein YddW (UPF0748 family)
LERSRAQAAGLLVAAACLFLTTEGRCAVKQTEATRLVHEAGAEARILWVDATANFARLCTPEGVRQLVSRCREAGINALVVDVKDLTGRVLYESRIAPRLEEYGGARNAPGFDLLRTASGECRAVGIAIYAAINVFAEGRKAEGGPVFDRPEWEAIVQDPEAWVKAGSGPGYPVARLNGRAPEGRLALFEDPAAAGQPAPGEVRLLLDPETGTIATAGAEPAPGSLLLSGTGAAAEWLRSLSPGGRAEVVTRPRFIAARHAQEMHNAIFVNPANREVRDYELSIIREIVDNYDIDGIVLDRMRYSGLNADFSEDSRRSFESWLGSRVERWPEDVLLIPALRNQQPVWGPLFQKWLHWRALNIRTFAQEARAVIKSARPELEMAVYVGSWYWSYYPLGVNWASDRFRPAAAWATPDYHRTGYAPLMDWITTGCYYPAVSREEASARGVSQAATVQAAAEGSAHVIGNASFFYAGLYLLDYRNDPEQFIRAVEMCRRASQGVMLFDLVYIEEYGWWDILKQLFGGEVPSLPHRVPELRRALHEAYLRSY